jgi:hypothetical protein
MADVDGNTEDHGDAGVEPESEFVADMPDGARHGCI